MMGDQPAGGGGNPAGAGGLVDHLRELCAAGAEYAQARLALAGMETKEALIHFGIIIALCVGAVAVLVFGYLFFCIALTLLIAQLLGIAPGWVVLALAVLHFVVAGGAIGIAVMRLKTSVFEGTLAELKKDQLWLSQTPR
jgi:uncharacterized membrane protein YqjE